MFSRESNLSSRDFAVTILTSKENLALPKGESELYDELLHRGIDTRIAAWNDEHLTSRGTSDIFVVRSCWDYHFHSVQYGDVLARLEHEGVRVFNPPRLQIWNIDKTYLLELESRGVAIVPTIVALPSAMPDFSKLASRFAPNTKEFIIKPVISATAHDTFRVAKREAAALWAELGGRDEVPPFLIQPYLSTVESIGELSIVLFAGQFSHAYEKKPKDGDFRVQNDFGGTASLIEIDENERALALRILSAGAACVGLEARDVLYARVDLLKDHSGDWLLGELEVIEPGLGFQLSPGSASRFVDALTTFV